MTKIESKKAKSLIKVNSGKPCLLKKFNYTAEESFKKLCEIQQYALNPKDGSKIDLFAALKAEELKGKLMNLYKSEIALGVININIDKDDEGL